MYSGKEWKGSSDLVVNICLQAFRNAWKIACASITKASIVIPHDKKFLVRPISFGGPCRAKVTVTVSTNS